ncbi:MAG: MoxR family ATPase [Planctomycetota bacterium]|nr:MoxR family ATPase [Planctomycetota bacterium]
MSEINPLVEKLAKNIEAAVIGKPEAVRLALVALIGQGHLLIEDAPGVGKTSLAKAIAKSLSCQFTRLQFTPDMLPSDILGSSVFLPNEGKFEFRRGPIFTNVLLADEINRTTPRTQSALLEAMNEDQVSIEGTTHPLAPPFFVLATQNPFEFEGTFPLPENQLDRFMLCIEIGYPDLGVERDILKLHRKGEPVDQLEPVLESSQLESLQQTARDVRVDDSISDYLLAIVTATRAHPELTLGVSTRGALTLYRAAQAQAVIDNRDFVTPDDVKQLAGPVLAHRVSCRGLVREGQRERARGVIRQILDTTRIPS